LIDFSQDLLLHENNIRVLVSGERHLLPRYYQEAIHSIESETKDYTKRRFNLLLGYSGTRDLLRAIKKTIESGEKLNFNNIIRNCMINTPIDFLVRTAKEKRISDGPFFLMQYTEFEFIPKFFPELSKEDIQKVLDEYSRRNRTFGI